MSIENLSLSATRYDREGSFGVRSMEAAPPDDIRLVWSTEVGSGANASFNVHVSVRGWLRGLDAQSAWKDYSAVVPAAQCNETKPDGGAGRVWWSCSLSKIGKLVSEQMGGSFAYEVRIHDSIDIQAWVSSNFSSTAASVFGVRTSGEASAYLYVGYVPDYTLKRLYYASPDTVAIDYETTWERKDDRFDIEMFETEDSGGVELAGESPLAGKVWGTVAALGRVEFPASALKRAVLGEKIDVAVRFNPAYRPSGLQFRTAQATLECTNGTLCSTPTLALSSSGETIVLSTGDSGDVEGSPCETVRVRMVGGELSVDSIEVPVGDPAVFRFAPFGADVEFEAVGGTSSGATSAKAARLSVPAVECGKTVIDSVSGGSRCEIEYRSWSEFGPSVKAKADCDTVKLAGRERPSSFYGDGGSTSVSFGGYVVLGDAADFERLAEEGDAVCRFPDGRRYAISPTVSVSYRNDLVARVDVSGEEVAL